MSAKGIPLAQFWVGCTCWRKWICAYWKWNSRTRFECVIRWRLVEFNHDHNRADSHCCYEKQQNYLLRCQGYHYHNTQKLNQALREKFIWITILIVLLNWPIWDLLDFNDNYVNWLLLCDESMSHHFIINDNIICFIYHYVDTALISQKFNTWAHEVHYSQIITSSMLKMDLLHIINQNKLKWTMCLKCLLWHFLFIHQTFLSRQNTKM